MACEDVKEDTVKVVTNGTSKAPMKRMFLSMKDAKFAKYARHTP
jgi:hypothetical protein